MSSHILHFSVGTLVFLFICVGLLGGCLIGGAVIMANHVTSSEVETLGEMPNGKLGPISESILNRKMSDGEMDEEFGKLNTQALAETKQGWLLDRIRARRQSRCYQQQTVCYQQPVRVQPAYVQPAPVIYPSPRPVYPQPVQPVYPSPGPLPSPIPTNPTVPVVPDDIVPSVPRLPSPDIQSLPVGIVPSTCQDGTCQR